VPKGVDLFVTRTDQGIFAYDPLDVYVGAVLAEHGRYQMNHLVDLERLVDGQSRILVLGTHIGAFFVPLARRCGEITGYEANPRAFEILRCNVLLNELKNATMHNLAMGETSGEIEFWASTVNSGGSKRSPSRPLRLYTFDAPAVLRVPMVAVDAHLENHRFDLIIVDIEGSEYFALKGMPRTLEESRALFIEFLPHHLENVACVSNAQFLEPIRRRFPYMRNPVDRQWVPISSALGILDDLRRSNTGADILFSKDVPG
jgi:FkbM family methyltransferase